MPLDPRTGIRYTFATWRRLEAEGLIAGGTVWTTQAAAEIERQRIELARNPLYEANIGTRPEPPARPDPPRTITIPAGPPWPAGRTPHITRIGPPTIERRMGRDVPPEPLPPGPDELAEYLNRPADIGRRIQTAVEFRETANEARDPRPHGPRPVADPTLVDVDVPMEPKKKDPRPPIVKTNESLDFMANYFGDEISKKVLAKIS